MIAMRWKCIMMVLIASAFISATVFADNYSAREKVRDESRKDESKKDESRKQVEPKVKSGETYYVRANMWFEQPSNFLSTNFHRGVIIPAGTEVKMLRVSGVKIRFVNEKDGVTYEYIHALKHSRITLTQLFDQYFSKESVMTAGGEFSKFTKEEQENIKNGVIATGMSKEAVLMAYGYPPSHKTPHLTSDVWLYWESRAEKVTANFKDNILVSIDKE